MDLEKKKYWRKREKTRRKVLQKIKILKKNSLEIWTDDGVVCDPDSTLDKKQILGRSGVLQRPYSRQKIRLFLSDSGKPGEGKVDAGRKP